MGAGMEAVFQVGNFKKHPFILKTIYNVSLGHYNFNPGWKDATTKELGYGKKKKRFSDGTAMWVNYTWTWKHELTYFIKTESCLFIFVIIYEI